LQLLYTVQHLLLIPCRFDRKFSLVLVVLGCLLSDKKASEGSDKPKHVTDKKKTAKKLATVVDMSAKVYRSTSSANTLPFRS
jgi:hypothetical protein